MTLLTRRVSLLVALFLLTSAATAYAECAWVLWQEFVLLGKNVIPIDEWKIFHSGSSEKACLDAKADLLRKRTAFAQERPEAGQKVEVSSNEIVRRSSS